MANESNVPKEYAMSTMSNMSSKTSIENDQCASLKELEDSGLVGLTSLADDAAEELSRQHLEGWRLYLLALGLSMSIFLSALDITIISTSLVSITNDLQAFEDSSWIVTSYLVSYSGFLLIWAKFGDIFDRKTFMLLAVAIFIAFSAACAGAQTAVQLIVLRAFQGIGGGGIFSTATSIMPLMTHPSKYEKYNGFYSLALGIAFLLGPILGGAINGHLTWRWIFLINIPAGLVAMGLIVAAMPNYFPLHGHTGTPRKVYTRTKLAKLDFPGCLLLLAAIVLLICALEEAGKRFEWSSPMIIAFLVIAGILFITFFIWQWFITRRDGEREPFFPWRFVADRLLFGIFLEALLAGCPVTLLTIELPQRFQAVNNVSPLGAGIRLLPYTLSVAVGSAFCGVFTKRLKMPLYLVVAFGMILQVVGLTLSYTRPISLKSNSSEFGYEVLAGFGVGLSLTVLLLVTPNKAEKRDLAVAMASVTQCRVLGGAIGVAIGSNLLISHVRSRLSSSLTSNELSSFLQSAASITSFSPDVQKMIREVFAEGYNMQLAAALGFSAAQLIPMIMMWERPVRIAS
ncbi:MAG: hypothetical protein Q9160_006891 [Pyrenula sp. 1 TL-2023]